jgi:hypothetical protein
LTGLRLFAGVGGLSWWISELDCSTFTPETQLVKTGGAATKKHNNGDCYARERWRISAPTTKRKGLHLLTMEVAVLENSRATHAKMIGLFCTEEVPSRLSSAVCRSIGKGRFSCVGFRNWRRRNVCGEKSCHVFLFFLNFKLFVQ